MKQDEQWPTEDEATAGEAGAEEAAESEPEPETTDPELAAEAVDESGLADDAAEEAAETEPELTEESAEEPDADSGAEAETVTGKEETTEVVDAAEEAAESEPELTEESEPESAEEPDEAPDPEAEPLPGAPDDEPDAPILEWLAVPTPPVGVLCLDADAAELKTPTGGADGVGEAEELDTAPEPAAPEPDSDPQELPPLDVTAIAAKARARSTPQAQIRRLLEDSFRGPQLTWRHLAVALVTFTMGLIFTANALSQQPRAEEEDVSDLVSLVTARSAQHDKAEARNAELRSQVADWVIKQGGNLQPPDPGVALVAGLEEVEGPGVVVRLWDAKVPEGENNGRWKNDDYVVHQGDIEGVMNALWSGGAEAMTVQGHRVISTTGVRCVGNVLYIAGRSYSPPYEIRAVGDPAKLRAALDTSQQVRIYLQYVDALGLGWELREEQTLNIPAHSSISTLRYAKVEE